MEFEVTEGKIKEDIGKTFEEIKSGITCQISKRLTKTETKLKTIRNSKMK